MDVQTVVANVLTFNTNTFVRPAVMYLQRAGKYKRPAWRLSQEQKDLDERPLRASQWPSHPW
jgi:hypothetical protein